MKTHAEIKKICRILRTSYPDVKTQLIHKTPFELLTATILSAQCTDKQVNSVTPELFKEFPCPKALADADLKKIENIIRSTGFFHNKAKHIKNCARVLVENFNSIVPDNLEELITLPGVGRKTANVVLSAAFGVPAIVVDTHVKRISKRIGLTKHTDPVKIEFDLMRLIPENNWKDFSLHLIYFGREICMARKPGCFCCPVYDLCDYPEKFKKKAEF
ncbi:Putative endonuclease III, Nth-like [Desulfonema limicola]|uniref:Endonuclease III n=1 Tax=Desulfonema limicola TaxID=45656 RepID=A0A975BBL2_9BACT|nr:endonuclease III [Desulfonema limicola]QTA82323.1 Putative endonuclease III, Nth-like [Desulfonema limicola]